MNLSQRVSPPPRVFLAGLFHETNTFASGQMSVDDFEITRGEHMLESKGNGSPLGAVLEEAGKLGWEIIPAIDVRATPGACAEARILDIFFDGLEAAAASLNSPVDAVFLVLHGAMVIDGARDVEGRVLARIREHPTLGAAPVFGVLDLHANYTPAMADYSNALLTYRENPHIDSAATAVRAARLLQASLGGGFSLRTRFVGTNIVWPPTGTGTASAPMKVLNALARSEERDGIHAINVLAGFAYADTPHTGVAFSIIYDPGKVSGGDLDALAGKLGEAAEMEKHHGLPEEWDLDAAIDDALAKGIHPVCLVESADNIGGGAPGDGTAILRALLKRGITNAGVILNDPEAVAVLSGKRIGGVCNIRMGGKGWGLDPGPVSLKAKLLRKSDGVFILEDRHSHPASMSGVKIEMGRCALVEAQGITILLTSRRTAPFDLGQWRSQGAEPAIMSFIGVKAAVGHRRAYDPISKASYRVRTPGPARATCVHFRTTPFAGRSSRWIHFKEFIQLPIRSMTTIAL